MPKNKKDEVSSISGYSDAIERLGEQRRQEEAEQTKAMEGLLPDYIARIPTMVNFDLLDHYIVWRDRSFWYMQPRRQKAMFRLLRMKARSEILERLESTIE